MTPDFKKKMELLAQSKRQKDEDNARIAQDAAQRRREIETSSIQQFNEVKRTAIQPLAKELNEAFQPTGDKFRLFSNEEAKDLKDRVKTFSQIYYFPKGRSESLFGLNTASVRFECFPNQAEVVVSANTELRPSYLSEIERVPLSDFDNAKVESIISDFVSTVTTK